jgi:dihydrofolate reductase
MSTPDISLIAAVTENGVIGRELDMPWKLSTDLKRFKALTMGKPMIMGRKTFISVGERPLPGRPHIIISRNVDYRPDGVDVVSSLEAALDLAKTKAKELGVDEVFVAGGGEIYAQSMPFADRLYMTHIDARIDGDTYFPDIDLERFEKVEETASPAGEKDNYAVTFATYRRRGAAK